MGGEGGRRLVGGRREKREGGREFFSFFPFSLLLFRRLGNQSTAKQELPAQSSPPKTMPSDNEEQAVDAKTVAELTEQV